VVIRITSSDSHKIHTFDCIKSNDKSVQAFAIGAIVTNQQDQDQDE